MKANIVNNREKIQISLFSPLGTVTPLAPHLRAGVGRHGRATPCSSKQSSMGRGSLGLPITGQRHGKTAANYFSSNLANYRWDLSYLTIDLKDRQRNLRWSLQAVFSLSHGRFLQQALLAEARAAFVLPCRAPGQQSPSLQPALILIWHPTKQIQELNWLTVGPDKHLRWYEKHMTRAAEGQDWDSPKVRRNRRCPFTPTSCFCQVRQLTPHMAQGKTGFFFQQRKQQSHSRAGIASKETSSSSQTPKLL